MSKYARNLILYPVIGLFALCVTHAQASEETCPGPEAVRQSLKNLGEFDLDKYDLDKKVKIQNLWIVGYKGKVGVGKKVAKTLRGDKLAAVSATVKATKGSGFSEIRVCAYVDENENVLFLGNDKTAWAH